MNQAKLNKQTVARKVREHLKDCRPGGIVLEVVEADVRRENSRWYVPIRTSAEPPKLFEYYEALAEVEGALEEQEKLTVLLVPG